jgi:hypothetical protein
LRKRRTVWTIEEAAWPAAVARADFGRRMRMAGPSPVRTSTIAAARMRFLVGQICVSTRAMPAPAIAPSTEPSPTTL